MVGVRLQSMWLLGVQPLRRPGQIARMHSEPWARRHRPCVGGGGAFLRESRASQALLRGHRSGVLESCPVGHVHPQRGCADCKIPPGRRPPGPELAACLAGPPHRRPRHELRLACVEFSRVVCLPKWHASVLLERCALDGWGCASPGGTSGSFGIAFCNMGFAPEKVGQPIGVRWRPGSGMETGPCPSTGPHPTLVASVASFRSHPAACALRPTLYWPRGCCRARLALRVLCCAVACVALLHAVAGHAANHAHVALSASDSLR